jgi:outer membrane protein
MKKIVLILSLSFTVSILTQAQTFIGGSFSFDKDGGVTKTTPTNGTTTTTDNTKTTDFSMNPQLGFFMSEKIAAGIGINFGHEKSIFPNSNEDVINSFGIAPFMRYYFADFNNFRMFATTTLGFNTSSEKNTVSGTTTDGPKINTIGLSIQPSVSYAASEKIHLEAGLNFMNFGFSTSATKTENPAGETVVRNNSFDLGFNSQTLFTTGFITVGMIYIL